MIKADIVKHVADSCGLDTDIASLAVESTFSAIKRSLLAGQNVYIRGFATFELRTAKEKVARNISQNTFLTIPAHTIVKFKPSGRLADTISKVPLPAKKDK